jgi:hypothetical protein
VNRYAIGAPSGAEREALWPGQGERQQGKVSMPPVRRSILFEQKQTVKRLNRAIHFLWRLVQRSRAVEEGQCTMTAEQPTGVFVEHFGEPVGHVALGFFARTLKLRHKLP